MKKMTMIFLALLSLNLFAAFQYQVSGYGGGYFSFDGTTSLKMDRPGVHKGLDYLFVKNSLVLGDNSWGYYLLSDWKLVHVQADGFLGTFSSGDKIGIWIANESGEIFTSTNTGNQDYTFGKSGSSGDDFCLYQGSAGIFLTPSHWEYQLSETAAPSGQPLPGVLASLLIGCGVAYLARRRKKSAA